jgi:hypothetical protein
MAIQAVLTRQNGAETYSASKYQGSQTYPYPRLYGKSVVVAESCRDELHLHD